MNSIQGKICVCTGAIDSATDLANKLIQIGADAYVFPMIEINHSPINKDFTLAIDSIKEYNWLLFTSKNGVHSFFKLLLEYSKSYNLPSSLKIAAVGSKTAEVISQYSRTADFVCSKNNGKDFSQEFADFVPHKEISVLFPTGNLTQNMIALSVPDYIKINKIITYKTEPPRNFDKKIAEAIKNKSYNHIIFTSPSGIRNFANLFAGSLSLDSLQAISIGPATSKQMKDLNITPEIIADIHNNDGIVDALVQFYSKS